MLSFTEYLKEIGLDEALITFAGKAYPKFGNVVILAGGAGSGKGFIKDKLMGVEGYTFDVDALKLLAVRTPGLIQKVKKELGFDMSTLDPKKHEKILKIEDNVAKLHSIIGDYLELDDARLKRLYTSIISAHPDRKPNLIFDVTLKDLQKLQNISREIKEIGYESTKIHIVWVIQDISVALELNTERDRTVPKEILINTHRGSSHTINDIINMGNDLRKYMDGDIVFAFNRVNVNDKSNSDTVFVKSANAKDPKKGGYIKTAKYFYVKRAGQSPDLSKLTKDIRAKISEYVPKGVEW